MNQLEIEQAVSSALTTRDAAQRAGEGLAYLLPLGPVLIPAGWLGYSAFQLTTDMAWHPMFAGVVAVVAAVGGLAAMGYAFALLPASLWALVGSGIGAVLGWLIAHNGLQADSIWSGGAALLGLALGAAWFFLLSRGSAAMLRIEQGATPPHLILLALHSVGLIFIEVAAFAVSQSNYNPAPLAVAILAAVAIGLAILRRLVTLQHRKTAIALMGLQAVYLFPLSVGLSRALWLAANSEAFPSLMPLFSLALMILGSAMAIVIALFTVWSRQSRTPAAPDLGAPHLS